MQRRPDNKIRRGLNLIKTRPRLLMALTVMALMPVSWSLFNPGLYARTPPVVQEAGRTEISRTVTVNLYFTGKDQFSLLAEQRTLSGPQNPVVLGRAIIRELAAGPRNKNLVRTLPDSNILRTFFIASDKTAYIDFGSEMWAHHPGGVQADMLAIYSIVNSLVLNMSAIDAVKILNPGPGREPILPAGHLDLHYPLKANILLIR